MHSLKFWKPPSNAVLESFKRDEEPKDEKKGGRRKRKKQAALASLEKKETGLELELGIVSSSI